MDKQLDVVTTLNNLGFSVKQNYRRINCGGCGVYAALIVEQLQKLGIRSSGIVAAYNTKNVSLAKARDNIKNKADQREWDKNGIAFYHVGVEFFLDGKRYHYDTSGVHPAAKELDNMSIYRGRMRLEDLKAIAGTERGWNKTFDRKDIPAIRKMVKAAFALPKGEKPKVAEKVEV